MDRKRTLLLSYPRSGNTWVRHIIERITNVKTRDVVDKNAPNIGNDDASFVFKRHFVNQLNNENYDKMILIVRNYKEVIARHIPQSVNTPSIWMSNFKLYIEGVNYYNQFNGDKLILYYEDVIDDIVGTLKKLITFLKIENEDDVISKFMDNYEKYRNASLNNYTITEKSVTEGKEKLYHYKKLEDDTISVIKDMESAHKDNQIINRYIETPKL